MAVPHQLTLGRVVLRLPKLDASHQANQWRYRTTEVLNRLTLHPSLPSRAILVVRQLPDPRPGTLWPGASIQNIQQWQSDAQALLEEQWRQAARPAYGVVPPSAGAVWFADAAEWLACFSWDVHQGVATGNWWWFTWLRNHLYRGPADTLFYLWQSEIRWLPQAIKILYRQHGAGLVSLLARQTPKQASTIRSQLAQAYALPADIAAQDLIASLAPWLPTSSQATIQTLPEQARALATLCLGIQHAQKIQPAYRDAGRMDQVPTDSAGESREPATAAPPASQFTLPQETDQPQEKRDDGSQATTSSEEVAPTPLNVMGHLLPIKKEEQRPDFIERERSDLIKFGDATDPKSSVAAAGGAEATPFSPSRADPTAPIKESSVDSLAQAAGQEMRTGVGGLWYLVNVLVELDWLPNQYSINGWHQLLGLAQALLSEVPPDPAWGLLHSLAEEDVSVTSLDLWVSQALPLVKAYLAERLQKPGGFEALILEPATVYVTRTHVDISFLLDQIRLDIRAAGLDQNPEWVPELGRIITFYYT